MFVGKRKKNGYGAGALLNLLHAVLQYSDPLILEYSDLTAQCANTTVLLRRGSRVPTYVDFVAAKLDKHAIMELGFDAEEADSLVPLARGPTLVGATVHKQLVAFGRKVLCSSLCC